MARLPRLLYDGAVYHIINRGHNRYRLFHTQEDYMTYKTILERYNNKYAYRLFHYCLMPNHLHLLVRIIKAENLPKLMQCVSQAYAKYYKKKYRLIGNLFQGRYKCLHIDKDEYLLECARYIERNPLRANMVEDIGSFLYSSYNFYAKGKKDGIISSNPLYIELSENSQERKKLYQNYILQSRPYEHIIDKEFKLK